MTLKMDGARLMCGAAELGVVRTTDNGWGQWLDTPFTTRAFLGVDELAAEMLQAPEVALRHAEAAVADAHGATNEAVNAARRGDKDAARAALARCDAHMARAKAWRELAGYEVGP